MTSGRDSPSFANSIVEQLKKEEILAWVIGKVKDGEVGGGGGILMRFPMNLARIDQVNSMNQRSDKTNLHPELEPSS